MSEAEVRPTHHEGWAPLPAAGAKPRRAAWLATLLLLAAGCTMAGDPVDTRAFWNPGGARGGVGGVNGAAGMAAGVGIPGTAGTPVGAGTGQPITAGAAPISGAGAGGRSTPPTAGGPVAGAAGASPIPDGGVSEFDAGTDPARNRVQAGQICARASAVQCAAEAHCCAQPAKSLEACKSQLTTSCTMQLYLDDIAKNSAAGYSPTQMELVLNKLEELSTVCDPNIGVWAAQPEGLVSMFQGTVPPNGVCKPSGLPSGGSFGGALASCTQAATTACLFTGTGTPPSQPQTATCAPRADAGATCFVTTNCKDGLFCANPQNTYSGGKCTPLKATGQTCTQDTECATFTCRSAACVAPTAQTAYCVST